MIVVLFQIDDKESKSCFFEKTFLLADMSIYITFEIFVPILSNFEFNFNNSELISRLYIAVETLFTTKQVKSVGNK